MSRWVRQEAERLRPKTCDDYIDVDDVEDFGLLILVKVEQQLEVSHDLVSKIGEYKRGFQDGLQQALDIVRSLRADDKG